MGDGRCSGLVADVAGVVVMVVVLERRGVLVEIDPNVLIWKTIGYGSAAISKVRVGLMVISLPLSNHLQTVRSPDPLFH